MMTYLATSYFHQDYQLEADTPIGVVAKFLEDEGGGAGRELLSDVQSILDCDLDDDSIGEIWLVMCGASYDPTRDGMTHRQWMERVAEFLISELGGSAAQES